MRGDKPVPVQLSVEPSLPPAAGNELGGKSPPCGNTVEQEFPHSSSPSALLPAHHSRELSSPAPQTLRASLPQGHPKNAIGAHLECSPQPQGTCSVTLCTHPARTAPRGGSLLHTRILGGPGAAGGPRGRNGCRMRGSAAGDGAQEPHLEHCLRPRRNPGMGIGLEDTTKLSEHTEVGLIKSFN